MMAPTKNFAPKKAAAPARASECANTAPAFIIKESRLLTVLGTSRDTLRELRVAHLTEGIDWQLSGRAVKLTEAAVQKIAAALKLVPAEAPSTPQTPRYLLTLPGFTPPAIVILKAWRFAPQLKSTHIIEAYLRGTDPAERRNIVRVRVRNTANFVRHMELPCRLIQPPDLYECTRPAPRDRGRW